MYVKPGNYETYLETGKMMLARAWGGAKNLMGNVDYALGRAQEIGNIAAPLPAPVGKHGVAHPQCSELQPSPVLLPPEPWIEMSKSRFRW